eukprot:2112810-Amphidinium_carterae.1
MGSEAKVSYACAQSQGSGYSEKIVLLAICLFFHNKNTREQVCATFHHAQPSVAIAQAAATPQQYGSFWPDSIVDKSSFMKILLHVLNVEAETDNRSERWEEELTASGACNASGVVDVKHVVAFFS